MKKLITILWGLLILFATSNTVLALTASEENVVVSPGSEKTISLYANVGEEVTKISFDLYFTTYDIPAYFYVSNNLTDNNPDGPNHKISLSDATSGQILLGTVSIKSKKNPKDLSGVINIQNGKATTADGRIINLNSENISVKIGEVNNNIDQTTTTEKETKESNLLQNIESNIVKIDLKENVYEYSITINKDIEELDLKPVPKKDDYKVEVSSQKIKDLQDNKITIKVSGGNNTEEYIIKVNQMKDIENVEVDNSNFKENNSYKGKWIVMIIILSIGLVFGLILQKKK